ncbi:MAG: hypothetical protein AAGG72_02625 [Pseudomonadota bacterium]
MSDILVFPSRDEVGARKAELGLLEPEEGECGELLLFTGVQYERCDCHDADQAQADELTSVSVQQAARVAGPSSD